MAFVLLAIKEVCTRTSMGKSGVYAAIAAVSFAGSIKLGPRRAAWEQHKVNMYIKSKVMGAVDKIHRASKRNGLGKSSKSIS